MTIRVNNNGYESKVFDSIENKANREERKVKDIIEERKEDLSDGMAYNFIDMSKIFSEFDRKENDDAIEVHCAITFIVKKLIDNIPLDKVEKINKEMAYELLYLQKLDGGKK